MRKARPIPEERIMEMEAFRKSKWSGHEFQRFLCVWLRAKNAMNAVEISTLVGWHPTTVRITQQDFIKHGAEALIEKARGGRRRALMTPEEEQHFLDEFSERAGVGAILVVGEVHRALEARLGHQVGTATTYRILKRNGWRKVVPRPFHPKRDPEAAEAFKKGAMIKRSAKPSAGRKQRDSPSE